MFLLQPMNLHYLNRYNNFIGALKEQTIDGYYELHHIIPKSSGGSNAKSNLIALTARQHYIAHWMLWKAYGENMTRAFFMMSSVGRYERVNSKTYDKARIEYSKQVKIQMANRPNVPKFTLEHREKLSLAKKGSKLSDDTKDKLRKSSLGRKASDATKLKISESKKGIATRGTGWKQSEATISKIGQAQVGALNHMYGKKHSMETKMKMKESHKNQAYLQWLSEGNTPTPADVTP